MSLDDRFADYDRAKVEIDLPSGHVIVERSSLPNGHFPQYVEGPLYVLTAFNPGQYLSALENGRRQQRLEEVLRTRSHRWFPAWGGDVDGERLHVERSAAIVGLSGSEAIALGNEFG